MRSLLKIPVAFILSLPVYAQESAVFDNLNSNDGEMSNYEDLNGLPASLRLATADQLRLCPVLNDTDIQNIVEHRLKYGPFISRYELLVLPDFTPEKIRALLTFFTIDEMLFDDPSISGTSGRPAELEAILTFTRKDNNQDGVMHSQRGRISIQAKGRFMAGIRFDQDSGEKWQWDPANKYWGADHVNFYFRWNGSGILEQIVAGSFKLNFGQGLIARAGFRIGKGAILPLPSGANFAMANGTFSETGGMNGIAVSLRAKRLKLIPFVSYSFHDASVRENGSFGTFSSGGEHVSASSIRNRKSVGLFSTGVMVEWSSPNGRIGIMLNTDKTTHPLINESYYKSPLQNGSSFTQASVHGMYRVRNLLGWIEGAISRKDQYAFTGGMTSALGRNLEWILLFRNFQAGFFTFHGNSFSEQSSGFRNETGWYTGLRYFKKKKYDMLFYVDSYHIPWYSYRHPTAIRGTDLRLDLSFKPTKSLRIRTLSRYEVRDDSPGSSGPFCTFKYQVHMSSVWGDSEFRLRMQMNSRTAGEIKKGILLAADWILDKTKTQWNMRAMYFNTDDYDVREFIYERDVWGSFSLPSYFGRGFRVIAMLRRKFNKAVTIWLRLAADLNPQLVFLENEVKIQLKYSI